MKSRDMTKRQLMNAATRNGFTSEGFLGYYRMPVECGCHVSVSVLNAGTRRRDQLRYLLCEKDRHESNCPKMARE